MPANITFTEFTDREVVWANVEAINEFFGSITVPDAGLNSFGVVKACQPITYLPGTSIQIQYYVINVLEEDGSTSSYQVALRSSVEAIAQRLVAIEDALNLFRSNAIAAKQQQQS